MTSHQNRVALHEDPTKGFTSLTTTLTLHPFGSGDGVAILIQGRNLTNAEIRHHTSFIKEILPAQGRDVRVMVVGAF